VQALVQPSGASAPGEGVIAAVDGTDLDDRR
jgi:hypothetical protein